MRWEAPSLKTALGYRSFKESATAAELFGFVNVIDKPEQSDFHLSPSNRAASEENSVNVGSLDATFAWLRDVTILQNQQAKSPFASVIKVRLKREHPEFG